METLILSRPYMHGAAVVRLQEMLDSLSPWYDTGPNDGIFGVSTARAVKLFQQDHDLKPDAICGPITWRAVLAACDHNVMIQTVRDGVADIIGKHPRPKNYNCQRTLQTIRGITLHQTGCEMPSNPAGWGRVNAHYGITQEGTAIRINAITDMIWHAQSLSLSTIGIEIEGNHHGIHGDDSTLWRGGGGPHYLSDGMVEAAEWILGDIIAQGATITQIRAHRQSSGTRRGDPGSEIWRRIAVPWIADHGLDDGGPMWRTPKGRVLPVEWGTEHHAYMGRY